MPYRTQPPVSSTIPAGYEVSHAPGCLTIAWRARGRPAPRSHSMFAGLCGLLIAHLLLDPRWVPFYLLAALVVGLVALAQASDRVELAVRGFTLVVAKSPLTPQARTLTAGEIAKLYAVCQHGEEKHTHELWCQLRGGGRLCLVRGLETAEAARYLEDTLERALSAGEHRPVAG